METVTSLREREKSLRDQLAPLERQIREEERAHGKALVNAEEARKRVDLYRGIMHRKCCEDTVSISEFREAKERIAKNHALAVEARNEVAKKNLLIARMRRDATALASMIRAVEQQLSGFGVIILLERN